MVNELTKAKILNLGKKDIRTLQADFKKIVNSFSN